MYEFRKQFDENLRKEHLESLFLTKRKKLLALTQNGGTSSRFGEEMKEAKNMIEETPEIFAHKVDYLKTLKLFEDAVTAFEKGSTPDDHYEVLKSIVHQSWYTKGEAIEPLILSAFYNSGLPKYILHFLKDGFRTNKKNLEHAITILSNAVLGSLEQINILFTLDMLDILSELVVDQQAMSGKSFGQLLWLLANLCGINEQCRNALVAHPRLLDEVVLAWDNRSASLADAQVFVWMCGNLLRTPFPPYTVGHRFVRRGVSCMLKYSSDSNMFAEGTTLVANWMRGSDEPTQRLRDLGGWGVWRLLRENFGTNEKFVLRDLLIIVSNITASNQEDLIGSMIDLDLIEDIQRWTRLPNSIFQIEAMNILRNLLCCGVAIANKVSSTEVIKIVQEKLVNSYSNVRLIALELLEAFLTTGNEARLMLFLRAEPSVKFRITLRS